MVKATVNTDAPPSVWRSIKLVAWSFLGIRSKSGYQDDLSKVNPLHVLVVALVGVLLLIVGLISLVNWVVAT
ncbi:DUF2970 domain-containing protein [Rhodoferax sp. AJA081-3]|jgi:hypothetical protein|uniref:DUF2970 domain-containing protein n=1 Tax=Rhodoferax sp. AJA081-3 TaxID=2752316 RepID=UPI001AE0A99B|nr:DUF2970 domain-containing protein [Rhodoferax sp. AJA081-3]QTN27459.1 DUF2970 domain-containing protein [Rhodoferax sp. AJA081-3]